MGYRVGLSLLILAGFALLAGGSLDDPESTEERQAKNEISVEAVKEFTQLSKYCEEYRGGANDIRKSEIYKEYLSAMKSFSVTNGTGEIAMIETDKGGKNLTIQVTAGALTFQNKDYPKKKSAIYQAVKAMSVGDCVTFSTKKARSLMSTPAYDGSEESVVCDDSFLTVFTSIQPCLE
jgi:hypothetical protein